FQGRYQQEREQEKEYDFDLEAERNISTTDVPISTAGAGVSTAADEEPRTPPTTKIVIFDDEDMTITKTLVKMRSEKSKNKSKVQGVVMTELSQPATISQPRIDLKDKGKGIMKEQEKAKKIKDQVFLMKKFPKKLKKNGKLKVEEQRRKPLTKTQRRNQMITYQKNIGGYKNHQLKNKNFEEVHQLFDKTMKRIEDFVPMDTKVERKKLEDRSKKTKSSKRVAEEE
nr:hypothetical protein [Tanacetum cinerariifolium]GEZ43181.1 hypothetical protein [Tanacetum cinerariifolium]